MLSENESPPPPPPPRRVRCGRGRFAERSEPRERQRRDQSGHGHRQRPGRSGRDAGDRTGSQRRRLGQPARHRRDLRPAEGGRRPDSATRVGRTPASTTGGTTPQCTNDWGNGYVAAISIVNTGQDPIDGWTLDFAWPTSWQHISGGWSGNWEQTGPAPPAEKPCPGRVDRLLGRLRRPSNRSWTAWPLTHPTLSHHSHCSPWPRVRQRVLADRKTGRPVAGTPRQPKTATAVRRSRPGRRARRAIA